MWLRSCNDDGERDRNIQRGPVEVVRDCREEGVGVAKSKLKPGGSALTYLLLLCIDGFGCVVQLITPLRIMLIRFPDSHTFEALKGAASNEINKTIKTKNNVLTNG